MTINIFLHNYTLIIRGVNDSRWFLVPINGLNSYFFYFRTTTIIILGIRSNHNNIILIGSFADLKTDKKRGETRLHDIDGIVWTYILYYILRFRYSAICVHIILYKKFARFCEIGYDGHLFWQIFQENYRYWRNIGVM